jgi:hypothetical protein
MSIVQVAGFYNHMKKIEGFQHLQFFFIEIAPLVYLMIKIL